MEILDERAEAFFIGAEDVLGFDSCGDIANHDKGAGASIEFGDDSGHLTGADVARFSTETEFLSAEFVLFLELSEKLRLRSEGSVQRFIWEGVLPRVSSREYPVRRVKPSLTSR